MVARAASARGPASPMDRELSIITITWPRVRGRERVCEGEKRERVE